MSAKPCTADKFTLHSSHVNGTSWLTNAATVCACRAKLAPAAFEPGSCCCLSLLTWRPSSLSIEPDGGLSSAWWKNWEAGPWLPSMSMPLLVAAIAIPGRGGLPSCCWGCGCVCCVPTELPLVPGVPCMQQPHRLQQHTAMGRRTAAASGLKRLLLNLYSC